MHFVMQAIAVVVCLSLGVYLIKERSFWAGWALVAIGLYFI